MPRGTAIANRQPLLWLAAGLVLVWPAGLLAVVFWAGCAVGGAELAVVAAVGDDVVGTGAAGGAAVVGWTGAALAGGGAGTDDTCELWETCDMCELCPPVPDTCDEWLTWEPTPAGAWRFTASSGSTTDF